MYMCARSETQGYVGRRQLVSLNVLGVSMQAGS